MLPRVHYKNVIVRIHAIIILWAVKTEKNAFSEDLLQHLQTKLARTNPMQKLNAYINFRFETLDYEV